MVNFLGGGQMTQFPERLSEKPRDLPDPLQRVLVRFYDKTTYLY